jgi:putative oxygen-independent coproporphyrinogen III oxidase
MKMCPVSDRSAKSWGVYVHVPYCAHRCGYCDFNTYVDTDGSMASYVDVALAECALAVATLGAERAPASTVFVGGGTPTLLPVDELVRLIRGVRAAFDADADAEVTVEANPETVDLAYLSALREGGATRLSLGMQSATGHVLTTLERRHTPGRPEQCVAWARQAGFEHVSLDLIYGTPGETTDEWRRTVETAVATGVDHVSAYALVAEPGTRLGAAVGRGEMPAPDGDDLAEKYEVADDLLGAAGLHWYEISNWARTPADRCRHNETYWRDGDWWGIGPGAHSHLGAERWWNVKLPREYSEQVHAGRLPMAGREHLDDDARELERLMLGVRLAEGWPRSRVAEERALPLVADGLLDEAAWDDGRLRLTRRGRLLGDAVVRALTP